MSEPSSTSGVQELIDRLSLEGVEEGEKQAERITGEARKRAENILAEARRQAEQIVEQARRESDRLSESGRQALQLACRDAVRDLASRIHEDFRGRLQQLVKFQLRDTALLREMILEITSRARPRNEDAELEFILPLEAVDEEAVRERIRDGEEDTLNDFVAGLMGDSVRDGITIKLKDDDETGLRIRVVNEDVQIDLTEEALSEFIAQHLLPRFRALIRDA